MFLFDVQKMWGKPLADKAVLVLHNSWTQTIKEMTANKTSTIDLVAAGMRQREGETREVCAKSW